MKFIHISDLHIGKRMGEYSLEDDHRYILNQIVKIAEYEDVDAVVIAGDVYDKPNPSGKSVEIFDDFLTDISAGGRAVLIISGNHDSQERIGYASRLLTKNNIYIAGEIERDVMKVEIKGVDFYLLPYIRPVYVRRFFDDQKIETYDDAVRLMLENIIPDKKSVLVAHQFVTSSSSRTERTDSETISVGGQDNISAEIFDKFDYVALGHLHRAQCVGNDKIRYCGTPLKFSKSEVNDIKSVTIVDTDNDMSYKTVELIPKRDVRAVKGKIDELLRAAVKDKEGKEDYIYVTLTDDEEVMDAAERVREIYHNFVQIDFCNRRYQFDNEIYSEAISDEKTEVEMFEEFYELLNNEQMTEKERNIILELMEDKEI